MNGEKGLTVLVCEDVVIEQRRQQGNKARKDLQILIIEAMPLSSGDDGLKLSMKPANGAKKPTPSLKPTTIEPVAQPGKARATSAASRAFMASHLSDRLSAPEKDGNRGGGCVRRVKA